MPAAKPADSAPDTGPRMTPDLDAHGVPDSANALLADMLLQRMPKPGHYHTQVEGLVLHRRDIAHVPENCFNKPMLAVTVQGAKRTVVGNVEFRYGAGHCLLAGVDMPSMSYLLEASPERPYLVLSLDVDSQLVARLAEELGSAPTKAPPAGQGGDYLGTAVARTDPHVLRAFVRLVELLDTPEQRPLLAPIVVREIHVRLLLGPLGAILRRINTQGTRSNQILCGVNWLRENFRQLLDVDALARRLNMAPSTFRKHFRAVTSMNPTQYHQRLRLYEAQRLMLEEGKDAGGAGYAVGYESLTQFSREYKRLFGAPPARSVQCLR